MASQFLNAFHLCIHFILIYDRRECKGIHTDDTEVLFERRSTPGQDASEPLLMNCRLHKAGENGDTHYIP